MITKTQRDALAPLLRELDPQARRVAMKVCRAYKSPTATHIYRKIKSEIDRQKRDSNRALHALRKLDKGLAELNFKIKKSLHGDIGSWCDVIRQCHFQMLDRGILLPVYAKEPTLKDYFCFSCLPDPAQPLENFLHAQREVRLFARKEVSILQSSIKKRISPDKHSSRTFSEWGVLQYALDSLFRDRTKGQLPRKKQREVRIVKILKELDSGGQHIDPDWNECSAIRAAIKRASARNKMFADRFLAYQLDSSRT
jgi:hypothetical protein